MGDEQTHRVVADIGRIREDLGLSEEFTSSCFRRNSINITLLPAGESNVVGRFKGFAVGEASPRGSRFCLVRPRRFAAHRP